MLIIFRFASSLFRCFYFWPELDWPPFFSLTRASLPYGPGLDLYSFGLGVSGGRFALQSCLGTRPNTPAPLKLARRTIIWTTIRLFERPYDCPSERYRARIRCLEELEHLDQSHLWTTNSLPSIRTSNGITTHPTHQTTNRIELDIRQDLKWQRTLSPSLCGVAEVFEVIESERVLYYCTGSDMEVMRSNDDTVYAWAE